MAAPDVTMAREDYPGATGQNTHSQTTDTPSGSSRSCDGEGGQTRWEDLPLSPKHVAILVASGITPKQAGLRGYETILDGQRLGDEFGFPEHVVHGAVQAQILSASGDVRRSRADGQ
jgi:hypothetical protein